MKLLFVALCFLSFYADAQFTRHIILLKDKQATPHSLSNPSTYLSARAIQRRTRQNINVDSTDLPVSPQYLDSIRAVPNVTILNISKWLNQVLIRTTDPAAIAIINAFPFVKSSSPIAPRAKPDDQITVNGKFTETINPLPIRNQANGLNNFSEKKSVDSVNYGNTSRQILIHEGDYLHNLGFTGQGIVIAMLDAGYFGYKTNPAFDSLRLQNRILGEYDFVQNEQSVNEDYIHGMYCLSIIASNRPGIIVGSAPSASFWLFRTEDVSSEYPVEEQNWLAAAEFSDSAGADMISSSLGYADFDDPSYNHVYAQRDGNTAISTVAADFAAKKGMIVMNSAGNSGNLLTDYKFVACPADGDSVVAVGATDFNGNIASFSSWGPNSAGKIKPNIVSVGQGTVLSDVNGNPATGNGTSFSNPNAAGLVACLWQAFPEFTNMQIIDAVQKSSHKYNNPDDRFGYGIPNFRKAYGLLEKQRVIKKLAASIGDKFIKAFPVPFSTNFTVVLKSGTNGPATLQLVDPLGRIIEKQKVGVVAGEVYEINFSHAILLSRGIYFVRYQDGKHRQTIKIIRQ